MSQPDCGPDFQQAFDLLSALFARNESPSVRRGKLVPHEQSDGATLDALRNLEPQLTTMLTAPNRDWAHGLIETAIAIRHHNTSITAFAAIRMTDRRSLEPIGMWTKLDALERIEISRSMTQTVTLLMKPPSFSARAAIGSFLAECGIGKGRLKIIVAPPLATAETISAGLWLDTIRPKANDLTGDALHLALTVRRQRAATLSEHSQAWLTSAAAGKFRDQGLDDRAISLQLKIPETLATKWRLSAEAAKAAKNTEGTHQSNATALSVQNDLRTKGLSEILDELPFLKPEAELDQTEDKRQFLAWASPLYAAWTPRLRLLRTSAAIRARLARGEPLTKAAEGISSSLETATEALHLDHPVEVTALERDISTALARQVRLTKG